MGTRALGQQASCASSWGSASSSYGLVTTESVSRNVQPRGAQVRPHHDSVFVKCHVFLKHFSIPFTAQNSYLDKTIMQGMPLTKNRNTLKTLPK